MSGPHKHLYGCLVGICQSMTKMHGFKNTKLFIHVLSSVRLINLYTFQKKKPKTITVPSHE
jgi:hypothetical protein